MTEIGLTPGPPPLPIIVEEPVGVQTASGPYEVAGFVSESFPGLAITPFYKGDGRFTRDRWTITHLMSGRGLVSGRKWNQTMEALVRLVQSGIDWHQPADLLGVNPQFVVLLESFEAEEV